MSDKCKVCGLGYPYIIQDGYCTAHIPAEVAEARNAVIQARLDTERKERERREAATTIIMTCYKCGTEMTPHFYESTFQMGGFGVRWTCPRGCYYKNDPSARWRFKIRDSGIESPDGWRTEGVKVAELEAPIPLPKFFVDGVEIKPGRYEEVEVVEKWVRRNLKIE